MIVNPYEFYDLDESVLTFLVIEIFLIPFFAFISVKLKEVKMINVEA